MAFFDRLGETLVTASKDVSKKAKDLSGVAKLNFDIKAKEDFIQKRYIEIGKAYFEAHRNDENPEYPQFEAITEAEKDIAGMKEEILKLRKAQLCPSCGTEVKAGDQFCKVCGAKIDDDIFEDADVVDVTSEDIETEVPEENQQKAEPSDQTEE